MDLNELRAIAEAHQEDLQLMLASIDGGRGVPVRTSIVQHLDAQQVDGARDLVLSVLVPKMRAQLAAELAKQNLRPLDPWPAVQITRWVWTSSDEYVTAMLEKGEGPAGMRELQPWELEEGRTPDLYRLELRTDAVPDTRVVEL